MKGTKWNYIFSLMIALAIVGFVTSGCDKTDGSFSGSVTNPNPETLNPTGTVQGVLRDAVTLQPIVNAVVDIDGITATTNANGQFSLHNVPATEDANRPGTVSGSYQVTINMKGVTSPVNMTDSAATPRYPDFKYDSVTVSFSSLNDTEGGTAGGGAGSNHDTPVTGLAATMNPVVGKLDGNIDGVVAGCNGTANERKAVGAGYTVGLYTNSSSNTTGSGAGNHLLGTTTTDANGRFSFLNVEANLSVIVVAQSSDLKEEGSITTTAPADGRTLTLNIEASTAIHVCSTDIHGPKITAVSPEPGSDLTPGSQSVVLTFSEPVAQNAFTSTAPSGVDNLYDWIEVMYDGAKAGNVAYSLAWNGAFDQLTVTIPNAGISSKYHVRLTNMADDPATPAIKEGMLFDAQGNPMEMGICPDDSAVPLSWGLGTPDPSANDCTVYFSTTGSAIPVAPTIALVNSASMDEGTGPLAGTKTGVFDWNPASGAKDYNMYCRTVQIWGTTEQVHAYRTGPGITTAGSSATVDFDNFKDSAVDGIAFVENQEIKLGYDCYVTGVSADGVEGAASNVVRIVDLVGPVLQENPTAHASKLDCPATGIDPTQTGTLCNAAGNITGIVLEANEELNEVSAETVANYAISGLAAGTAPTVSSAIYNAGADSVTLTLSAPLAPQNLLATRITTGTNGIANTTAAGNDDNLIPVGQGAPGGSGGGTSLPYSLGGPCVIDNGPATLPGGDDSYVTMGIGAPVREIVAGGNGICETTADAAQGDIQLQPVGVVPGGRPSGTCVIEGAADEIEAPDDVDTTPTAGGGFIHVGPNGICNTTATGVGSSQPILVGQGVQNTTAILDLGVSDGKIEQTTLAGDDAIVGGKVTVTGVTDVGGNTIRTVGDEYYSDGSVR